jgi:hypothetical protein
MGIAYNTSVVRDGLVLHLDAANVKSYPGSGTTWYDLSGNGNNGTLWNGIGYSSSNNGSLVFDGVDDSAIISTLNLGNGNLPWTCSAWIKTTTTATQLGMGVNSGKIVYWTYYSSAWQQKLGVGKTVNDNNWHLLTWVNYSNSTMNMYVDGELDSNVANSTSGNNNPINIIGASWTARYAGSISNVLIYNQALSANEVKQNFEALRGRYGL